MVSRSTDHSSRCQSQAIQNLRCLEEVVEHPDHGEEECTGESKEEGKEIRGGSVCESRTAEINLAVQHQDMEWQLAEPEAGRGLEHCKVPPLSCESHLGSAD